MTRRKKQQKSRKLSVEYLNPRVMLDGTGIDLEVTKDVDTELVDAGDNVTWTVTIENNAADAGEIATGVQVRDALPAGLTLVSVNQTKGVYNPVNGNWFIGSIASGDSHTLTLVTTVDAGLQPGTMIENVAQVLVANGDDIDSSPNNDDGDQSEDDEDSAKITIQGQSSDVIDLEVTKHVDVSIVNPGDTVTWTLNVENNAAHANANASGVVLLDVLPAGLTLVNASATKGAYNVDGTWFVGSIAPGDQETLTLVTTVDAGLDGGTMIENVVQVTAAEQADVDSMPNNDDGDQSEDDEDSAKITLQGGQPVIDLELTKDVDASAVSPGDTVTFTVNIVNNDANANVVATSVVVLDVLPAGLTLVSADETKGVYNSNGTWFIGSLVPGQDETLTLVATVDAGFTGGTITNVAQVFSAGQNDVDSAPNNDDGDQSEDDEDSAQLVVSAGDGLMLSGFSYVDTNNDGIFQAAELSLLGVEIQLTGTNSGLTATTFTDSNGFYKFNDLPAGLYTVTQVQPVQFVDGQDTIGNLGGSSPENDKLSVNLTANGEGYNFGELGLRPEFVNKRLYLTSTPYNSWEYIDVRQSSVWYSFSLEHQSLLEVNGVVNSGVASFLVFDSSMNPVTAGDVQGSLAEPIALTSGQYYLQLSGDTIIDSLTLALVTPSVTVDGNTVIAVGSAGDDNIELHLGHDTHVLNISGLEYLFDATVVDTIHIGASTGDDHITIHGTDLDDTADALGSNGHLQSSDYDVYTYSADKTTFVGGGGNDYSQLYGSLSDDKLSALPHDVTLETPDNVFHVLDFDRVDSYGRGGFDYAELYGTLSDDLFVAKDAYTYMSGAGTLSYTKDFERVDGYGRAGHDVAHLFDSVGSDFYFSNSEYSVLANATRISKAKGFEAVDAMAVNGGSNIAKFVELKTGDEFQAYDDIAVLVRADRDEEATGFDHVIVQANAGENPTALISATDYALTEDANWI